MRRREPPPSHALAEAEPPSPYERRRVALACGAPYATQKEDAMDEVTRAATDIATQDECIDARNGGPPRLPFRTVVADPPWPAEEDVCTD